MLARHRSAACFAAGLRAGQHFLESPRHPCPTSQHLAQAPYVVPARSYLLPFPDQTRLLLLHALYYLFCGPRTPNRDSDANSNAHTRPPYAHPRRGKRTNTTSSPTAQWGKRTGTTS